MSIKLFHKGTAPIQYGTAKEAVINPGDTIEFPDKEGKLLRKLFPKELLDSDALQKQFVSDAKASMPSSPQSLKARAAARDKDLNMRAEKAKEEAEARKNKK